MYVVQSVAYTDRNFGVGIKFFDPPLSCIRACSSDIVSIERHQRSIFPYFELSSLSVYRNACLNLKNPSELRINFRKIVKTGFLAAEMEWQLPNFGQLMPSFNLWLKFPT